FSPVPIILSTFHFICYIISSASCHYAHGNPVFTDAATVLVVSTGFSLFYTMSIYFLFNEKLGV
ncbi:hypothetical protein ACJX0J_031174, partial [Zea mays]